MWHCMYPTIFLIGYLTAISSAGERVQSQPWVAPPVDKLDSQPANVRVENAVSKKTTLPCLVTGGTGQTAEGIKHKI